MMLFQKRFRFYKKEKLSDGEIFLFLQKTMGADEEKGYVPTYYFEICGIESGESFGRCDLRIGHNENIYYGGNIGYFINESSRGNHYALKACRLLLPLAKRHGLSELIITCNPDNTPSRRTVELLGARYIEQVRLPVNNELYRMGERQKCIYKLTL